MLHDNTNNKRPSLMSKMSSLLFISHKPLSITSISKLIGVKEKEIEDILDLLINYYNNNDYGLKIVRHADKIQMTTDPVNADMVGRFLKSEIDSELSKPSLETLTIIAYRGPISKFDLDRVRGVNCAIILRNLSIRGLIEQTVTKENNNVCYSVSIDFLRFLGLNHISDLPDYQQFHNIAI